MSTTQPADVNSYQVGGSHYARGGDCQHWDWIERNGMGYLEGCATKYVSRWRFKNGVQDLHKALHYVAKIRDLARPRVIFLLGIPFEVPGSRRSNRSHSYHISAAEFARANSLSRAEYRVCKLLQGWRTIDDLDEAEREIRDIIAIHEASK